MNATTLFRGLLVLTTVLFAFWYWMPLYDSSWYSADVHQLLDKDGFGARYAVGGFLTDLIFIVSVLLPLLMYFFIPWARTAFLILCVAYPVFDSALGVRVLAPVEVMLGGWIAAGDGAILALAYFSPVASHFARASAGAR